MSEEKESKVIFPDDDVPKQPGRIIPANEAKSAATNDNKRRFQLTRKNKLIIFVAVVLIIVLAVIFWPAPKPKKQVALTPKIVCQADTLKQASALFLSKKSDQADKLDQLSTKIQALPDYQSDPNCLFIVTSAYLNISDYDNALTNLNKLETLDPNGDHLNVSPLFEGKLSLDNLKAQVVVLGKQTTNTKNGVIPSQQVKE